MKKILVSIIMVIPFILSANGDSRVVYNSYVEQFFRNESPIPSLPAEGELTPDRFCYDEVKDAFLVNEEERKESRCVREEVTNRSDTTYPRKVCVEWQTVVIPAKTYYTDRTYTKKNCTKYDYSRDYRHPTCLAYEIVTKKYPLTYSKRTYNEWDYRRENPIFDRKDIPYCK